MKKINVSPYKVEVTTSEGLQVIPYNVTASIESILLANGNITSQRLNMSETLRNARIAEKIKAAEDKGHVLLEEAEFNQVKKSFNAFSGFGKNEVELCKRIEEVEDVEVEEKKKNKK